MDVGSPDVIPAIQQNEAKPIKEETGNISMENTEIQPRVKEVTQVMSEVTTDARESDVGEGSSASSEPVDKVNASHEKVIPLEIVKSTWTPETRVIEISLNGDADNKLGSVFHIMIDEPATTGQQTDSSVVVSEPQSQCRESAESCIATSAITDTSRVTESQAKPVMVLRELPLNCPTWAARLKDCEEIGNSYRGYVENEVELDLLLTYHRQQTGTTWGTRQSPSTARESKRLMWKSNYVPYDGIPFLNLGSRAIVMECQYGPRRKGGPHKRAENSKKPSKGSCTCPARIYVKKVRKFPDFQVDISCSVDKMTIKRNMDKVFQIMKEVGVDGITGVDRVYVQLPTNQAHQYHSLSESQITPDPVMPDQSAKSRLHPELCDKIQELVTNGEINAYIIRQILRAHVTRTMFAGGCLPERHNLYYFPTINDIRNHVLLAIGGIEKGELEAVVPLTISDAHAITEPPPSSLTSNHLQPFTKQLWESGDPASQDRLKPPSTRHQIWSGDSSRPQTQSVTVTLTQNPDAEGGSFISQVETQLTDGTTFISDSLTPETARLLSQINQHCQEAQDTADGRLGMHQIVTGEHEEMVQSESLLEETKSITSGLNQSEEDIIDSQKNDPPLTQSDAMMGLTDTSSDDGNNQSESLLQPGDDAVQSPALLDTAATDISESEGLLHDAANVETIDESKHLLNSVSSATGQSDPLLQGSDRIESAESLEGRDLLSEPATELSEMEQLLPEKKRARYDV